MLHRVMMRNQPHALRVTVTAALLAALAGIGFVMTACTPNTPVTRAPGAGTGAGTGAGGEPPPAPTPEPEPAPPEPRTWALEADHFGDDGGAIWAQTTNRSQPFAWDRITAGNVDDVRVSIGGVALGGTARSFTSTAYAPAFADDYSGAEWTVQAEVEPGAVVLVLTAPNQRRTVNSGMVESVTVTAPGAGYTTGEPTITFSAPPAGGTTATGRVLGPGEVVRVGVGSGGSGYTTSAPTLELFKSGSPAHTTASFVVHVTGGAVTGVTVTNPGHGYFPTTGWSGRFVGGSGSGAIPGACCTALRIRRIVTGVEITNPGSGYVDAPTITITGHVPTSIPIGSGATAVAVLGTSQRGNTEIDNLYWARQTLYGRQLLIELADGEAAAGP